MSLPGLPKKLANSQPIKLGRGFVLGRDTEFENENEVN